jgi:hypothetical protein
MRTYLEIILREAVDPFDIQDHFKSYTSLKVNVIDNRSVRIWFNESTITPKRVASLVSQAASKHLSKN